MSEYVELTRQEIREEYEKFRHAITDFDAIVEEKVDKEVHQAMQGVVYNLNTMHARAGSQVPFSGINIGLPKNDDAAKVCQIFLEEFKKGMGKGETVLFPNICFAVKSGFNRNPGDPYYYLFKLACEVAARRMNPTFMNMDNSVNIGYYEQGIRVSIMG